MIGVFGDSYADENPLELIDPHRDRLPWTQWLSKLTHTPTECYGKAASSTWYSYKLFLQHYTKYSTVVFCYSDLSRWPNINDSDGNPSFGLNHVRSTEQLPYADPDRIQDAQLLTQVYPLFEDQQLDAFLFQAIFNSINELCDSAGIKCVNILTFEELWDTPLTIDISTTTNTVLTNLLQVSGTEYLNSGYDDPHTQPRYPQIAKLMSEGPDKRFCHLNLYNNRVLAELIIDCLKHNTPYVNTARYPAFSYDWEHIKYLLDV